MEVLSQPLDEVTSGDWIDLMAQSLDLLPLPRGQVEHLRQCASELDLKAALEWPHVDLFDQATQDPDGFDMRPPGSPFVSLRRRAKRSGRQGECRGSGQRRAVGIRGPILCS
jgi:hypothetical protein